MYSEEKMGIFTRRRFLENFEMSDGEIRLEIDRSAARQFAFTIRRISDDANVGYCDLRLGHSISLYYYGNIGYHWKLRKLCRLWSGSIRAN